jgi:hypothetical protein
MKRTNDAFIRTFGLNTFFYTLFKKSLTWFFRANPVQTGQHVETEIKIFEVNVKETSLITTHILL